MRLKEFIGFSEVCVLFREFIHKMQLLIDVMNLRFRAKVHAEYQCCE